MSTITSAHAEGLCENCGSLSARLKPVTVQGSILHLCRGCSDHSQPAIVPDLDDAPSRYSYEDDRDQT